MYRPPAACWSLGVLFLGASLICPSAALADTAKVRDLKQQAEAFERQGEWEKACDKYEEILRFRRDLPQVKARYVHCVRRLWQVRRHHDDSYRKEVLSIEYGQAVHLYVVLRDLLLDQSLDRKRLDAAKLFRKGLDELDNALADAYFCQQHIPSDRLANVAEFRAIMLKTWSEARPRNRKEALKQLCEIALAAQSYLRLNSAVVVMEFACGACYSLDEYTVYLTPMQLRELCSSLRGDLAGVGLTFVVQDNKVFVQQVDVMGPAAKELREGDQVVSVDKKAVASLSLEALMGLIEGPAGSVVELEVVSTVMGMRTVVLRRQASLMPSVNYYMLADGVTGYVRIAAFQETTIKETEDALARLGESGMKALVLDLHGNGGGLFDVAVEIARRFLPTGIIATRQHLDERSNIVTTLCEAKNPAALTLPLVVLVDNDTASAAEMLAGALKENNRATVVGQTTYGKGCTQFLLKLPDFKGGLPAGGMRLTVAKVFSPKGLPYTGRGVVPDIVVPSPSMMAPAGFGAVLAAAQLEAQRLLNMTPR